MNDRELLNAYLRHGSEPAATELITRYLDLVYSAALRQVNGDTNAAEEIAQSVFVDLVRKASELGEHTSLAGWLYTSTRYVALNHRRTEQRRRTREQTAFAMNEMLSSHPEPDWSLLRGEIDEAMSELVESEREAIVLRYFQDLSLKQVGERINISENAARMRVDRAMDKLRELLEKRGVKSTAALLGGTLARSAVSAAPVGLAGRVANSMFAIAPVAEAATASFWATLFASATGKVAVGGLAALAVAALVFLASRGTTPSLQTGATSQYKSISGNRQETQTNTQLAQPKSVAVGPAAVSAATNAMSRLTLRVLAAESGEPIPNGVIELSSPFEDSRELRTDSHGVCQVDYQIDYADLRLTTRIPGYAETQIRWPRKQDAPASYTVKLIRGGRIGGQVVDVQGKPVPGAIVSFGYEGLEQTVSPATNRESVSGVVATTGADGRWFSDRIVPSLTQQLFGYAHHPDHAPTDPIHVNRHGLLQQSLLEEKHVFKLGGIDTVEGIVVDEQNWPINGAKVVVGFLGRHDSRTGTSGSDGRFSIQTCPLGDTLLSAVGEGFPVTTLAINVGKTPPQRIVLKPGRTIRLRVTNREGKPMAEAQVWNVHGEPDPEKLPLAQVSFSPTADADGRVVWTNAPSQPLKFFIVAEGYMHKRTGWLEPDGSEHQIVMEPRLRIFGTVKDATTGKPVEHFKIITGWHQTNGFSEATKATPQWSTLARAAISFTRGSFDYRPSAGIREQVDFIFKCEADGYEPWISRIVNASEQAAELNIEMKPAETP